MSIITLNILKILDLFEEVRLPHECTTFSVRFNFVNPLKLSILVSIFSIFSIIPNCSQSLFKLYIKGVNFNPIPAGGGGQFDPPTVVFFT